MKKQIGNTILKIVKIKVKKNILVLKSLFLYFFQLEEE